MKLNRISFTKDAFLLIICSGLSACSNDQSEPPALANEVTYNTQLNVQQIMGLVLEPASDVLWDSAGWVMDAAGYEDLYPTTDEGWEYVRAQAAIVVESGNMLALPGRAEDDDAWMIYSEGLSDAGILAMEAAAEQNEEDFFQAGAQLYSVCTACHQAYNPDINSRFVDGTAD